MSSLYQRAIHAGEPSSSLSTNITLDHTHVRLTSANPFTPDFVQRQLLTCSSSRSKKQVRALYDQRVRRRQLVLASKKRTPLLPVPPPPPSPRPDDDARMGRREAAEKGLWRLRADEAKWEMFVPLHRLWVGYMSELLGLASTAPVDSSSKIAPAVVAGMHAKLVKADFHGSIMTVRRSRNAALVGAEGIVVQETENTFKVVTRKDKLKVLPKQGSVFVFAVPLYYTGRDDEKTTTTTVLDGAHVEFELYGNQFCFRAADRAGRKFKHKESIEL